MGRKLILGVLIAASAVIPARAAVEPAGGENRPAQGPASLQRSAAKGPLRVLRSNPRYFTDGSGRAIYLTGSHTWDNLVETKAADFYACRPASPDFAYPRHLRQLKALNHNFFRLWTWELARWGDRCDLTYSVSPLPWARTGPGTALDGLPKFDLRSFNEAYFRRLRSRVRAAQAQGIYVSIMLFEGWGVYWVKGAWSGHPFNPRNNVNEIDGDANDDGKGIEIHTLVNPRVTAIQEAYVRKVIDTVNDLDNVLYEVANESHNFSTAWQYHMIRTIKRYEARKPQRHPVGMTYQADPGSNENLWRSAADWISPSSEAYLIDPPLADGRKVSVPDTDHHCGVCGDATVIWKNFMRGHNPIYMDVFDDSWTYREAPGLRIRIGARRAMGQTRRLAAVVDLAAMRPRWDVCSTKYCLVSPGREYLVYQPQSGRISVDLRGTQGTFRARWFHPTTGRSVGGRQVRGGGRVTLPSPFAGQAVLYLRAAGA
jgi:hypothetical protein